MTPTEYEAELQRVTRTLSEISHTLESKDDSEARMRRVLRLTEKCVPYQRCALLTALPGRNQELFATPEPTPEDAVALRSALAGILRLMTEAEEIGRSKGPIPHLALPVVGLDRIVGVLRVEPSPDVRYEAKHLRLLSVIAAQLAAYLTTLQLLEDEASRVRELASANEFQKLTSGVVSHDLRTPLSVISMVAQSLLRKPRSEREAIALQKILSNVLLADRIIHDLADATRARTAGGLHIAPRPTELIPLLEEVLENAKLAHPGREISLTAPASVRGEWDPQRLAQLVNNLLTNAFVHGREDAPVQVRLRSEAGAVELSVHNEGPPIPGELLPVIFDPFRQGRPAQPRGSSGGLGLGLYIVSQIVKAHGGEVSVQSRSGEGTTFTIRLPLVTRSTVETIRRSNDDPRA